MNLCNNILDICDGGMLLIGKLDMELLLNCDHQFNQVQRIQSQLLKWCHRLDAKDWLDWFGRVRWSGRSVLVDLGGFELVVKEVEDETI